MSTNPSKINISGSSFVKVFLIAAALMCIGDIHAQCHSLCWRISGNGLKQPSYLYGTMHVSDKRVFNFGTKVTTAFEEAKTYAMELDPEKAMSPDILTKVVMKDGVTLKAMLPDSDYRFADSLVTIRAGVGLAVFDHMEPIVVTAMLEEFGMDMSKSDTGSNMEQAMDLYFYQKAQTGGKKTIGIETVDEQIDALHSMSYQEQTELLSETIKDIKKADKSEGKDILKYYISQQLDSLAAMSDERQMPPKFYKALVTDRNVKMADRIARFIEKQSTFIAIGALHLPGNGGVVALLRKKGYKVEEWK
jgi:uncharacterized protein YbaP (TraB family)